ncbi:hypothetical protein [Vibrio phage XM1]|nr:hypothetical protein [Vibrio phage XM1]
MKFEDLLNMDMGELSDFVIANSGRYELVTQESMSEVDGDALDVAVNAYSKAKLAGCDLDDCIHDAILSYLEELIEKQKS